MANKQYTVRYGECWASLTCLCGREVRVSEGDAPTVCLCGRKHFITSVVHTTSATQEEVQAALGVELRINTAIKRANANGYVIDRGIAKLFVTAEDYCKANDAAH